MREAVVLADLGVDVVGVAHAEAELHVGLSAPRDVVTSVDSPAGAASRRRRELGHVALELGETLAGTLDDVGVELAGQRLRDVLGAGAGRRQEVLALLGVVDLEVEALARGADGDSVDARDVLVPSDRRLILLV